MKRTTDILMQLTQVGYTIDGAVLLSDINLNIVANDRISIIGPNGAGKSTLVKLMLGLIHPSQGQVNVSTGLTIGYVPQKFTIPSIMPLRVCDLLAQVNRKRLSKTQQSQLFTALSIDPLLHQQLIHLSGGETQRVLLARALLLKPDVLILDEPMQGLDPETEDLLYQFIDELPDYLQCAMLVISHDLDWVMKGSRHVVCLNKHICCEGQPADIQLTDAFQKLFGGQYAVINQVFAQHKYERPYFHQHTHCQHTKYRDTDNQTDKMDNQLPEHQMSTDVKEAIKNKHSASHNIQSNEE